MPALTAKQWQECRDLYESEPIWSLGKLAERFGVEKSTVSRRRAAEGWTRKGELAEIAQDAQLRADASNDPEHRKKLMQEEAVNLRAGIIADHRTQWAEVEPRRAEAILKLDKAMETGSDADMKVAKDAITALLNHVRALAAKQEGERKAWGLDVDPKIPNDGRDYVLIERSGSAFDDYLRNLSLEELEDLAAGKLKMIGS